MAVYLVTGSKPYHDVPPGNVLHARLDPAAERRAIERGALEILDATPPGIVPGSYQPPDGWDTNTRNLTGAPQGASLIEGSTATDG